MICVAKHTIALKTNPGSGTLGPGAHDTFEEIHNYIV